MIHSSELRALGWALLSTTLSAGGVLLATAPLGELANALAPPVSPALVEQGRQAYAMSCAECHADDAHGDEGPDLHQLALSDGRIAARIRKGIKGQMPSFAKKYDQAQVASLVAYLRSLR